MDFNTTLLTHYRWTRGQVITRRAAVRKLMEEKGRWASVGFIEIDEKRQWLVRDSGISVNLLLGERKTYRI